MQRLATILLLLCSYSLAGTAWPGAEPARASTPAPQHYLEDRLQRLSLSQVAALPVSAWQRQQDQVFARGYNKSNWWLQFELHNPDSSPRQLILEVGYPLLDQANLYQLEGDRIIQHQQLGLASARSAAINTSVNTPVNTPSLIAPLTLAPHSRNRILLQVRSQNALLVPLTLWQPQAYYEHASQMSLLQGFYVGTVLVLILYNLMVYLGTRDKTFLLYVCFALSLPAYIAALKGYNLAWLWPLPSPWMNAAIPWSLALAVFCGALFTEHFLGTRRLRPWAVTGFRLLQISVLLLLCLSLLLDYRQLYQALIVVAGLNCLLCLTTGLLVWRQGGASTRYITLGWSAVSLGGVVPILSQFGLYKPGLIEPGRLSEFSLQLGSCIQIILLSFALAARINEERRLRTTAQRQALNTERETRLAREQALQLQQHTTEQLEYRVQERTRELEQANRQLVELSETDQLTGLKNRRYLDRILEEELVRRNRPGHDISVLLIDVDHFKRFNDVYGHLTGDECLKAVADILQIFTRNEVDCAARYGGEEFCLLLPETGSRGATEAAERIREQIESMQISHKDETISVTISVGICSVQPWEKLTPAEFLKRADEALYAAKQAGRNRVILSTSNPHDGNNPPASNDHPARNNQRGLQESSNHKYSSSSSRIIRPS